MERLIKWLALSLLTVVALANGALFAGIWFTRDPAPHPLDGQRIFAASRPALVLVQANYQLTVSTPEPTVPKASEDKIDAQLLALWRAGRLNLQKEAIREAAINLLLSDPDAYFVPGTNRITNDVRMVSSGSGFFVTEDGYLVTAAHVVSASKEDLRAQIVKIEKGEKRTAERREEIRQTVRRDLGIRLNDSQLDRLSDWAGRWSEKYVSVDKVDVRYYLGSGTVEAGQRLTATGTRVSLVKTEAVAPGKDVAVMKANVTAVPALALADGDPSTEATTYVIGYPRRGYLEEETPADQTVAATLTSGKVRKQASMDGGWTAYGTDAELTHGNSGGPVLDSKGHVLGMASFIRADAQGHQLNGEGYFVPAGVIKETIEQASVKPSAGALTDLYYKALYRGDFHQYKHELAILSQVQVRSASHAYVKDAVSETQSAVLSGKDQTPPELQRYVPASLGAAAAAAALAMAAGIWLRLRQRKRRRDLAAAVAELAAAQAAAPDLAIIIGASELPAETAAESIAVPNGATKEAVRIG